MNRSFTVILGLALTFALMGCQAPTTKSNTVSSDSTTGEVALKQDEGTTSNQVTANAETYTRMEETPYTSTSYAKRLSEERVLFHMNGKWALFNENLQLIAKLDAKSILTEDSGAIITDEYIIFETSSGATAIMDKEGELLIQDLETELQIKAIKIVTDNYLIVESLDGGYGTMNLDGLIVTEPVHEMYGRLTPTTYYLSTSDGDNGLPKSVKYELNETGEILADVSADYPAYYLTYTGENEKLGLMDANDVQRSEAIYESIKEQYTPYKWSPVYFLVKQNGKYGVINKYGETLVEPTQDTLEVSGSYGYAFMQEENSETYGVFNLETQEWLIQNIPSEFDTIEIREIDHNQYLLKGETLPYFIVKSWLTNEIRLYDETGRLVLEGNIDAYRVGRETYAYQSKDGWTVVDSEGTLMFSGISADGLIQLPNGTFVTIQPRGYQFLNEQGDVIGTASYGIDYVIGDFVNVDEGIQQMIKE